MTPDNAPPPYRMTVTTSLPYQDAVALTDQLLAEWLKEEGHDQPSPAAPDQPPERLRLGDRVLLDRDSGVPHGASAGARYSRRRLRTPAPHGAYQVTLTLATDGSAEEGPGQDGSGPSVWLRVEADQLPAGRGVWPVGRAQVPELVRALLPLLDATDGPSRITLLPRVIGPAGLDGVIDELCDPDRRLPVVIASVPPAEGFEPWLAESVHPVMRQLPGLASLYVLSHAALPLFNVALEYHKVYGGAVRTYLPEVDPASRADSVRHPVLPRHRIDEDVRRAAALLAREPRRLAAALPLPEPLAAVPQLELPPEARIPVARNVLDVAPQREIPLPAAPGPQYTALRRAGSHVRLLTDRLRRVVGQDTRDVPALAAEVPPAEDEAPTSFGELVDRFDEFPLLEFTGDEKETLALDGQSDGISWARLTWGGLTALQEYAAAAVRGLAGGDFKQWCEQTPPGCHRFPPRKAVRGESRAVVSHGKWKRQRMLPVPACVEPSRRAFMGAHLRIGGGGTAPRVHYLDDCSGSGRIYIGYIGLHLTNTRTN